jgi:adenosylcobinamide kinase/adenosylcobinamide-phosphate guanylyltransferase
MSERIETHRRRRGDRWRTVEAPIALTENLAGLGSGFGAVLVDCITLWITNLLLLHDDPEKVLKELAILAELLPGLETPCILISNEVGMGIVPENRLARIFRDVAGEANRILAEAADEAYLVVSGLPLRLK